MTSVLPKVRSGNIPLLANYNFKKTRFIFAATSSCGRGLPLLTAACLKVRLVWMTHHRRIFTPGMKINPHCFQLSDRCKLIPESGFCLFQYKLLKQPRKSEDPETERGKWRHQNMNVMERGEKVTGQMTGYNDRKLSAVMLLSVFISIFD